MELASDSVRLLASRVGTTGGDWHVDDRFQLVDNEHPLIVSSQQRSVAPFVLTFDYWLLSRSLGMCNGVEVFFLGERTTKFVALSRDRFRRIVLNESTCTLTVDVHVWYKEQVVLQVAKQMQSNRSVSVVERTMSGNDPQFERRFGEQWIEVQVNM
jgi:hypothetical protein